ncbi:hypothetical protein KKC13_00850 [bacterium]|nr:hypothetical protein [bacterium]MBU1958943.1 hypothetical protein [bacterium]
METFDKVKQSSDTILTYIVIKSNKFGTLREKLNDLIILLDEVKELKKRGKLPSFFGRLEISFKRDKLGFNPHLNLLVWGDYSIFQNLANSLGLNFWHKNKNNDTNTIKSIVWYMLKFNSIGIEKGETVKKALNKKRTIINSSDFSFKTINYTDEYIDIDFSPMCVYPIRSSTEVLLRSEHKKTLQFLRKKLKLKIDKANNDFIQEFM